MFTAVIHTRLGFAHKWEKTTSGGILFACYKDSFEGFDETNRDPHSLEEDVYGENRLLSLITIEGIGENDDVKAHNTLVLVNRVADALKHFKVELTLFFADNREAKRVTFVKDYSKLLLSQWTLDLGEEIEEQVTFYQDVTSPGFAYRDFLARKIYLLIGEKITDDISNETVKMLLSIKT